MSETRPTELLAWIDVETTGLNPPEDRLLQVAAIITDLDGNQISKPLDMVVRNPRRYSMYLANEFVRDMHTRTGLWDRIEDGAPSTVVDSTLLTLLKTHAPEPRTIRVAGNSVRLDLNFMQYFLPDSYAHVHYRSVDVSAISYALGAWGVVTGEFQKRKTHNAIDDIHESIAQYRWLMKAAKEATNV